jgi:peroxiredoxin family protein
MAMAMDVGCFETYCGLNNLRKKSLSSLLKMQLCTKFVNILALVQVRMAGSMIKNSMKKM